MLSTEFAKTIFKLIKEHGKEKVIKTFNGVIDLYGTMERMKEREE